MTEIQEIDRAGGEPVRRGRHRHAKAVVHVFKRAKAGQYCLSIDRSGGNIPRGLNGEAWVYVRDLAVTPGEYSVPLDADVALDELARAGYHLMGGWYDAE